MIFKGDYMQVLAVFAFKDEYMQILLLVLAAIIIQFVVFILLRQFLLWYWRVNHSIKIQNEILLELRDIKGILEDNFYEDEEEQEEEVSYVK